MVISFNELQNFVKKLYKDDPKTDSFYRIYLNNLHEEIFMI